MAALHPKLPMPLYPVSEPPHRFTLDIPSHLLEVGILSIEIVHQGVAVLVKVPVHTSSRCWSLLGPIQSQPTLRLESRRHLPSQHGRHSRILVVVHRLGIPDSPQDIYKLYVGDTVSSRTTIYSR